MAGPPNIPLTWRNVSAPSSDGALKAFNSAGENLGDAFKGLGGAVKQGASDYADQETQNFIADLNAAPDDATRKQMVADASQAFLKMDQVNAAVTDAEGIDFRRAGEARDVEDQKLQVEKHRDDLLTSRVDRKIAEAEENERLKNEDVVRKEIQAQIKSLEASAANTKGDTSLDKMKLNKLKKEVDNDEWVSNTHKAMSALEGDDKRIQLSKKILEGEGKGADVSILKNMQRKAFDAETGEIPSDIYSASGVTSTTTAPNGAPVVTRTHTAATYKKLKTGLVERYAKLYPNMDRTVLEAKATADINATEDGTKFTDAIKQEGRSVSEKNAEKRLDHSTSATARLDGLEGPALVKDFGDTLKDMRSGEFGDFTQAEIESFTAAHRPRVLNNMEVDLSKAVAIGYDDAAKVTPADLAKMQEMATKQVRKLIPDATPQEIEAIQQKAELGLGNVKRQQLIDARSRVAQEALLSQKTFQAAGDHAFAMDQVKKSAELREEAIIQEVNKSGSVAGPVANEMINYFTDRHTKTGEIGTFWGWQYGDASSEEIVRSVTKMDEAVLEFGGKGWDKGKRAKQIMALLKGGELELTGKNEIAVMYKGKLTPVDELSKPILFDLIATTEQKAKSTFITDELQGQVDQSTKLLDDAVAKLKNFESLNTKGARAGTFGYNISIAKEDVKQFQEELDTLKKELADAVKARDAKAK